VSEARSKDERALQLISGRQKELKTGMSMGQDKTIQH
jgi:hypothetical protein